MENKSILEASNCTVNYNSLNCFDKLTDEEMHLLEKNTREITYNAREIICKQNTFASHIMFVCSGLVKTYIENDKDSLLLRIIPAGSLIGLSALMQNNSVFSFSAASYVPTRIKMFDINVFRHIIKTNALFASEIINIFCENSIQIYGRFFSLTKKQSYGRLADLLLCLSARVYKAENFELLLSRKEIAELSGLSREKVIRILKEFKESKYIETHGKVIKILDYESLQKISDFG
jgi:CRP/FNR family transcriptional regulator